MWSDPLFRILLAMLITWAFAASAKEPIGLGRAPSQTEIAILDIDVRPDGAGLPAGRGTVAQGAIIFAEKCESCHLEGGTKATHPTLDVLVGGQGTLTAKTPVRTVGSYWPHATTLFDYVRRAMPFNAPQSLTNDEVYAVSAFLLHRNGLLASDAALDRESILKVKLPNADGFIQREDWRTPAKPK